MTLTAPADHLTTLRSALGSVVELPDATWAAAVPLFSHHHFPAGVHVIEAGEVVSELHFLTGGLARYYYLDSDGREYNKSFSGRGEVLSSVTSLVAGQPSPFFVQTLLPCDCLSMQYADFLMLSGRYREWNRLQMRMLEQLVIRKERREADFLLLSAGERYTKFIHEYAHIADSIPNYHIASYVGITEVALSRLRRRLGLTRVKAAPEV